MISYFISKFCPSLPKPLSFHYLCFPPFLSLYLSLPPSFFSPSPLLLIISAFLPSYLFISPSLLPSSLPLLYFSLFLLSSLPISLSLSLLPSRSLHMTYIFLKYLDMGVVLLYTGLCVCMYYNVYSYVFNFGSYV